MKLEWSVEQVFVRPSGAQLEVMMVIENPAGARFRERFTLPGRDHAQAVRSAARYLARRGQVTGTRRLRLRVERSGDLQDDSKLLELFAASFRDAMEQE